MKKILIKSLMAKNDNEIVDIVFKSNIYLEDTNDLVELFKKCSTTKINKKYGIVVHNIITCLRNINAEDAETLMIACKLLHKEKRKVSRLLDDGIKDDDLKTFGRLCAIADRSCYNILKEKYNIVRTISTQKDDMDFVKY